MTTNETSSSEVGGDATPPAPFPLDGWKARSVDRWPQRRIGIPALGAQERLHISDFTDPPTYVRVDWTSGAGKKHRGPVLRTELVAGSTDQWLRVASKALNRADDEVEVQLSPADHNGYSRSRIWASRWTTAASAATALGAIVFGLNATEISYVSSKPAAWIAAALLLIGTACAFCGWFVSDSD